jgi:DNA-directed RNA polymerase subunit K/omega
MSAPPAPAHPLIQDRTDPETVSNRFLLSSVAFLRSKQLKDGATARIERGQHKPTYIAVLEVMANTISWSRV